ncbi:FHA domain-containing protein [Cellulomonas sp. URHB0016]
MHDDETSEHDPVVDVPGATDLGSDGASGADPDDERPQLAATPDGRLDDGPGVGEGRFDDGPGATEGRLDDGPGAADLAEVVAAAEAFLAGPRHVAPHRLIDLPDVPTASATQEHAGDTALGAASADDHDGLTILSSDLAAIRDQLPSWAADEAPGPFRAPTVVQPARIVLSTGLVVTLDRAVLLGRAPQVARVTNRELPRLVTVPSPQQDISRTHAEVRVEGEHVLVTDLDSTNGVHVSRPGEGARRLHPGEASVVGTGEIVDLGDGVTFTVERGS